MAGSGDTRRRHILRAGGWVRQRSRDLSRTAYWRNRKVQINEARTLNRRELTGYFLTFSLAVPTVVTMAAVQSAAAAPASGVAPNGPARSVKFRDGTIVPALGQGSWHLGEGRHPDAVEEEALRTGISLGMTLIDTAEVYSNGRSEELIGRVIAGQRDRVFVVSKIDRATDIAAACEASLLRLGTNYLDLYLLHWPFPGTDLSAVVAAFESLRTSGKIRAWGVSNFKVSDMEDLFRVPDGHRCATNQVLYNLSSRGIERDVLPWCEQHGMPVMAYSPLGGSSLVHEAILARIGAAHDCAATAVALAWVIRSGNVIAIAESGSPAHVKENAVALSLTLTPHELQALDAAYPVSSMDILRSLKDRGKRWLRSFPTAK
jgi:diketogulonate reductase-like aldo/keto reductase